MKVLVPIDGSECSGRALAFAGEFAGRHDAVVHVVHFTERADDWTRELLADAESQLADAGVTVETEWVSDVQLSDFKASTRVGENVLSLVEVRDYDHVVMGHHGTGRIGEFLLGSAAERVVKSSEVPVTIIP